MLACVQVEPKNRLTIAELQKHPFIELFLKEKLDTTPMEDTNVTEAINV